MPGNTVEEVTITIAGETWELSPPQGWKAMVAVPKIIRLASNMIYVAGRGGLDLSVLLTEEGFNFNVISQDVMPAIGFIAEALEDNWATIVHDVLPILLCRDGKWLLEHGTPIEHFRALGTALNFHAPYVFGNDAWEALKKSPVAVEAEEKDTTTDSE